MEADEARLLDIKDRAAAVFMALPGVTGVGIGGRLRDGRPTGELVLKVFVARKRPAAELTPGQLLPAQFEGVGVDVAELGEGRDLVAPPGSPLVPDKDSDEAKYRPLIGGTQVQVDLTGAELGTLGCFLRHATDPNRVFAMTNFHVVSVRSDDGTTLLRAPTSGSTRVGQPTNQASSTKCCSDQIGTFTAGCRDNIRDAAIVQLDPGAQWLAEVQGIGRLTGPHDVTQAEATTHTYQVRKRGGRTRLTGGTVEAINTTQASAGGIVRNNVMVVRPNPNPAVLPPAPLFFADHGDSGSVIVNDSNEVVALLFGGATDAAGTVTSGLALPIGVILGQFGTTDGTPVTIATSAADGAVQTVPGGPALRMPAELAPGLVGPPAGVRVLAGGPGVLPVTPSPTPELLAGVRARLDASRRGRQVTGLWLGHQPELVSLVNEHRRVAVVWQRCGGPALVQTLIRMVDRPDLALPATVNGEPLAGCLSRIHDAFAAQAGPELRRALGSARAALPDLAGLTFPQIVAALDAD